MMRAVNTAGKVTDHKCPWCLGTGVDPAAEPPIPEPRDHQRDPYAATLDQANRMIPDVAAAAVAVLRPSVFALRNRDALVIEVTNGLLEKRTLHPAVIGLVGSFIASGDGDKINAALVEHHHVDLTSASLFGAAAFLVLVMTGQVVTRESVIVHARLAHAYWLGRTG